jgi:glutathione S-transferase
MNDLTLIIGNKNYSSWSLRPWLLLKQAAVPFKEIRLAFGSDDLSEYSPSGLVPALKHGSLTIWDSLAIAEYLAEQFPEKELWPRDVEARAIARSVSAEMHSGFINMRTHMNMNCRGHSPGKGVTPEVSKDIQRIQQIWQDCRTRFGKGGEFLFGKFSIADAMYAPVTFRFVTYAVPLSPIAQAYVNTLQGLPAMQEWLAAAKAETEAIEQYEQYRNQA